MKSQGTKLEIFLCSQGLCYPFTLSLRDSGKRTSLIATTNRLID